MPKEQIELFESENELPSDLNNKNICSISRADIELDIGLIEAETWPSRHKVHKYWGRKPANIVSRYIEYFSHPGEMVLDLFSGSGITVVEAARINRNAVGYDINYFAHFLGNALISPPSHHEFQQVATKVIAAVSDETHRLFSTHCRNCGEETLVQSYVYELKKMTKVRYRCTKCRSKGAVSPTARDMKLSKTNFEIPEDAPDGDVYFGWEMQKLKRRSVKKWSDLFTKRNFHLATRIRQEIMKISDKHVRNWMLLTLTASLAQSTRMIADFSGKAGGPSWKINCYWLPDRWQELNPLQYFNNRVKKSISALKDLTEIGAPFTDIASIILGNSRNTELAAESVDYIFTDPPYGGEGIQYGELSMLWCLWLGGETRLEQEVAFNPYRGFDQSHYDQGISDIFKEAYRVLRPGRWMTVTFANKDPEVWDGLMNACRNVGFLLVAAVPMKRSAPSLTEVTMRRAPKADLVLTFQKPSTPSEPRTQTSSSPKYDFETRVRLIHEQIRDRKEGNYDVHDVFDAITIDWFSWYYENGQRPNALQPTLESVGKLISSR